MTMPGEPGIICHSNQWEPDGCFLKIRKHNVHPLMRKLVANYFGNEFRIEIRSWRTVDTCPSHIVDQTNPLLRFIFALWRRFVESRPSSGNFFSSFSATLWGIFIPQNRSFVFASKSCEQVFVIFLLFLSGQNQMVNRNEYVNSSKWVSFDAVVCANAKKKSIYI